MEYALGSAVQHAVAAALLRCASQSGLRGHRAASGVIKEGSEMRVHKSIEIAEPPEKVWPYFVEPEKVLAWYTTFRRFEYTTDQRAGVGTPLYIEEQTGVA